MRSLSPTNVFSRCLWLFVAFCSFSVFFIGSVDPAQAIYCWCKNDKGTCESHTENDPFNQVPLSCSSGSGRIDCDSYCLSRGADWRALNCDPGSLIPRGTTPVMENGREVCPDTRVQKPAQPVQQQPASTKMGSKTTLDDPLKGAEIADFISRIIQIVVGIVGAVALLLFVYGGFLYMTGTEESVKQAKSIMKNAVLGLLLIFFSYMIINLLFGFFSRIGEV
jgi:hypothetical protein